MPSPWTAPGAPVTWTGGVGPRGRLRPRGPPRPGPGEFDRDRDQDREGAASCAEASREPKFSWEEGGRGGGRELGRERPHLLPRRTTLSTSTRRRPPQADPFPSISARHAVVTGSSADALHFSSDKASHDSKGWVRLFPGRPTRYRRVRGEETAGVTRRPWPDARRRGRVRGEPLLRCRGRVGIRVRRMGDVGRL